ncbi:MAG: sugar ABC transporter ATP-binding protein, partial [Gemmatimonadetes bacterium]|nr:sugar ABC transporter ATP-binding protein [Gemmatimonadota bacterium]
TLALRGESRRFSGPADAAHAGIATIHQELSLVPPLSVADNLFLGRERVDRWGRVDFRAQEEDATRLLVEAGLEVSPRHVVAELPVSTQQMLEIVRALARDAAVGILDEPTSALSEREADTLFARLAALRAQGRGIVYITHRMDEIYRLADRITVLRDGSHVGTFAAAALPPHELVARLVGRALTVAGTTPGRAGPEEVLRVTGLSVADARAARRLLVDDVSFGLRRGEILGLAGLQGSGASQVLHALYGDAAGPLTGTLTLEGTPFAPRGPGEALRRGLALLTSDRKAQGLAPDQSVLHSVRLASLASFSGPGGWIRREAERREVTSVAERLRLKAPDLDAPMRTLSGGNQQKAYLARCMLTAPKVLLLDQPTRGSDIGAKADIYALLREWAAQGIAILLITSELDELLLLSHRILVMHRGRVVSELRQDAATKEGILAAAMGHGPGEEGKRPGEEHP